MLSGWKGSLQNSPFETSVEQRQQRSTAVAGKKMNEERLKRVSNMKVKKRKIGEKMKDYKKLQILHYVKCDIYTDVEKK